METEYEVYKKYMLTQIQMKKRAVLSEIGIARKKKQCIDFSLIERRAERKDLSLSVATL